ncbi:MAG: HEAT repeat domain-containing protein [Planctomycetota bacterium]
MNWATRSTVCGLVLTICATAGWAADTSKLVKKLQSSQVDEQIRATEQLAGMGPDAASAADALADALTAPYWHVRKGAAKALAAIGPPAVPVIEKTLRTGDYWGRMYAAEAIGLMASQSQTDAPKIAEATEELILALQSDLPEVRMWAAWAVGQIGPQAKEATPVLIEIVRTDKSYSVRYAIRALGRIGAEKSVGVLVDQLDGPYKAAAVQALGEMGPTTCQALLDKWDNAKNNRVAWGLIETLGEIGPTAAPAVPKLIEELKSPTDQWFAALTARVLGQIGPKAEPAVPELVKMARSHSYPDARANAARGLGPIGVSSDRVRQTLQQLAENDEKEKVRKAAREAVKKLDGE